MMAVLQNAFANSSSSLMQSKMTGNIVFVLLPPLSHREFFLAYLLAAMARGVVVGAGVFVATHLVRRCADSAAGMGDRLRPRRQRRDGRARHHRRTSIPTRSTSSPLSRTSSSCRSRSCRGSSTRSIRCRRSGRRFRISIPIFYMVDGFRYGFFGQADVSPWLSSCDCRAWFPRLIIADSPPHPRRLQAAALTATV